MGRAWRPSYGPASSRVAEKHDKRSSLGSNAANRLRMEKIGVLCDLASSATPSSGQFPTAGSIDSGRHFDNEFACFRSDVTRRLANCGTFSPETYQGDQACCSRRNRSMSRSPGEWP